MQYDLPKHLKTTKKEDKLVEKKYQVFLRLALWFLLGCVGGLIIRLAYDILK